MTGETMSRSPSLHGVCYSPIKALTAGRTPANLDSATVRGNPMALSLPAARRLIRAALLTAITAKFSEWQTLGMRAVKLQPVVIITRPVWIWVFISTSRKGEALQPVV